MANDRDEALTKVRAGIRRLQAQISDRLLKISSEINQLLEHLTPKETSSFLHAACDMAASDAATYLKIAKNLKGATEELRASRAQFPLLKALASADNETRDEAVFRIRAGARLESRDVAAIRSEFRRAKISTGEYLAQAAMKKMSMEARSRALDAVKVIDQRVASLIEQIELLRYASGSRSKKERSEIRNAIAADATRILPRFEAAYGSDHRPLTELLGGATLGTKRRLGLAFHALRFLAEGRLGKEHGSSLDTAPQRRRRTDIIRCLRAVTSAPPSHFVQGVTATSEMMVEPSQRRLKVFELCAGAGGMAIGLEAAGYAPVALVESDKNAAATLRANRPEWNVIQADMRTIDFSAYRSMCIDLLVGGLPCQPYSVEGKRLGKNDPRDLLLEGARAVTEMRPWAFVFENVVGLLHARHADHLGNVLSTVRKAGYSVWIHRIETEDYGIAQERTRLLIVGMRGGLMANFRVPPSFPEWRTTLGDALLDLMAENGWTGAEAWAEARRNHLVVQDGVELRGVLASTIVGRKGGAQEKEQARWASKGLDIAKIADAAPTQEEADHAGKDFLPSLTLRMRARLQGFPDWWQFMGGKDSAARQIGNAVPPVVGQAIGLAVRSALEGETLDYEGLLAPLAGRARVHARALLDAPSLVPSIATGTIRQLLEMEGSQA